MAELLDDTLLINNRTEIAVIKQPAHQHTPGNADADDGACSDHNQAHVPGDCPLDELLSGDRTRNFQHLWNFQDPGIPREGIGTSKGHRGSQRAGDPQAPRLQGRFFPRRIEGPEGLGRRYPARELELLHIDHLSFHGNRHHHTQDG
jgi:hypothetical protein